MIVTELQASATDLSWQSVTSNAIQDLDTLAGLLQLDTNELKTRCADTDFALRVPRTFVSRMEPGNIDDPLLLQVLQRKEAQHYVEGYVADPLQDYPGAALQSCQ